MKIIPKDRGVPPKSKALNAAKAKALTSQLEAMSLGSHGVHRFERGRSPTVRVPTHYSQAFVVPQGSSLPLYRASQAAPRAQ